MIDSHAHLSLCEPPQAELVARAAQAGVGRIVTVATTSAGARAALAAAEAFPAVYAAVGRHPNEARGFDERELAALRTLAAHEKCVAIGETGLDYYREQASRADQMRAFAAQIELARELDKPLVIHSRDAHEDTVAMLVERAGELRVILHCFTMSERIEQCLEHDRWWISFAGNVTYPRAAALRAAAARVPAGRLLVETDAPFLAPQAVRGKPNQPANVVHTARALAAVRGVSYEQLEAEVERAAAAVFGW